MPEIYQDGNVRRMKKKKQETEEHQRRCDFPLTSTLQLYHHPLPTYTDEHRRRRKCAKKLKSRVRATVKLTMAYISKYQLLPYILPSTLSSCITHMYTYMHSWLPFSSPFFLSLSLSWFPCQDLRQLTTTPCLYVHVGIYLYELVHLSHSMT